MLGAIGTPEEGQSATPSPVSRKRLGQFRLRPKTQRGREQAANPLTRRGLWPRRGGGRARPGVPARCEARCAARLPHSSRASLPAWLGTGRDTQLQALSLGAVAPPHSAAVTLAGDCRRAPCVHVCVRVQARDTCPWRWSGHPQQPPQTPARFLASAYERPQAWLEPTSFPANTWSGGRQIPNLDQTPPEAVGQACWDALPWAGCVSRQLSAGHTPGRISAPRGPLLPGPPSVRRGQAGERMAVT